VITLVQIGCICGWQDVADILKHTATHCNTLQHTATHCNTLMALLEIGSDHLEIVWGGVASTNRIHFVGSSMMPTHCNTLQHTVTYCNTLQHIATHCSRLHYWLFCKQDHNYCLLFSMFRVHTGAYASTNGMCV